MCGWGGGEGEAREGMFREIVYEVHYTVGILMCARLVAGHAILLGPTAGSF